MRDIRIHHHGIIRVVHHKAGLRSGWFFYMLFLNIVYFHFFLVTAFGIVGSKSCGILEGGGVHAVRPEAATSILYVINPLRVRHLKRRPKLPARARIITNGLGGIFPRGLTVGFLVDEQDEGEMELEREGDVLPAVDFPALENVFIRRED